MTCPSDEKLALLAEGTLSPAEREEVLEHLAACDLCRAVAAFSAPAPRPATRRIPRRFVKRDRTPGILGIAAAAAVVIAAVFLVRPDRPAPRPESVSVAPPVVQPSDPAPTRPEPEALVRPQPKTEDSIPETPVTQPPDEEIVTLPEPHKPRPETKVRKPAGLVPGVMASVVIEDTQGRHRTVDASTEIVAGSKGEFLRLGGVVDVWLLPGAKVAFSRSRDLAALAIDVRAGEALVSADKTDLLVTRGGSCFLIKELSTRVSISSEAVTRLGGPLTIQGDAVVRDADAKWLRAREKLMSVAPARRSMLLAVFDPDAFPAERGRYDVKKGSVAGGVLKAEKRECEISVWNVRVEKPVVLSFRFRTDAPRVKLTLLFDQSETETRIIKAGAADRDGWRTGQLVIDGGMVGMSDQPLPLYGLAWSFEESRGTFLEIDDVQIAPKN